METGVCLTACLHFCNQTPTEWYSKKQATVETATYSSEFVAAKTATEQITVLRYTLRYLGVHIKSKSYMFGNNRSVVTSATLPYSTLSKRHNILVFHRVREAIAANIIDFHWIQSEYNLSDMLSKHWEHTKIFPMIQKLLITCGPTTQIPREATEELSKQQNKLCLYNTRHSSSTQIIQISCTSTPKDIQYTFYTLFYIIHINYFAC